MHRILLRQIQRAFGENPELTPEWQELLAMVSTTYEDFDKDRVMIERSLEISSMELRLAIATMRTTLDSIGEGVLVIDENQKIAYYNKRFVEIWQLQTNQITAHQTEQVVNYIIEKSEDPAYFREVIDKARSGQDLGSDTNVKLTNKNVITIKSYPQLLEGKAKGRVWIFRDITKYINFKEEIQDKVTTLERLNKTMVDRELKMIELKTKIEALEKQQ